MSEINLNYLKFKETAVNKSLLWQFTETAHSYTIFAIDGTATYNTVIFKNPENQVGIDAEQELANKTDFETNYKADANLPLEKRSFDNVQRVATTLYQVEDSFYIQGKNLSIPASSTANIEYQFAYDIKMIGVLTQWKGADEGDFIEASIGYYDGETWVEIMKYGETLYLVNGNSVDISTNDYASIPAGLVVRISFTNTSSTASKYFVTWMKCYR